MDHCLKWKKEIDDAVQLSNGDPIPIVLIANKVLYKTDYTGSLCCVHIKVDCVCDDPCDGEQLSKEHGFVGYFKTSARTGDGVKEAVHFMVKTVCTVQIIVELLVVESIKTLGNLAIHFKFARISPFKV